MNRLYKEDFRPCAEDNFTEVIRRISPDEEIFSPMIVIIINPAWTFKGIGRSAVWRIETGMLDTELQIGDAMRHIRSALWTSIGLRNYDISAKRGVMP